MSVVVQLFIMKNGALEGTELVSGDRFVIGSDPSCACVLEDPSVGARHLGVFVHDGKLAIQDLGAPGGTRVGGELVTGARYVGPRDDVVVGVFTLKLKLMSGAKATSGPSAPAPGPSAPPAPSAPAPGPSAPPAPLPAVAEPPPVSARPAPAQAVAAPTVARATVQPRAQNVMVGTADLERTVPGAPPPPPPVTDPPARALSTSDDERTALDAPARHGAPPADAGLAAARAPLADLGKPVPTAAPESGPLSFTPLLDDDEDHDDDELPWSLVQRLVRPPEGAAGKNPVIEIVHYRGERVIDHRVVREGQTWALGDGWSRAERKEAGLEKPLPLVRLKKDGVAEILGGAGVQGKLLRGASQSDLPTGGAAPLVDGELCSLRVGNERVFVRFAGVPALLWSPEDIAEARAQRRLTSVSLAGAIAFFVFFGVLSWIYGYRSKSEDIIDLEDDGFAEVVVKDLEFEEPPKEPEKKPEPVKTAEPVQPKPEPKSTPTAKVDAKAAPTPAAEPPKPGLAAMLDNIPKVNDSSSNQNLTAALSNIKGVRVPGEASGFKTSALTGKGPSSGVQIGGAAGGLATSGINSLIRRDGAAGQMGGKGDRQVAGKVTVQPRLSQTKGTGELSKDEIQRVISSHVGEIQYCYEKQLRTNAGLAGRVVLEWTVTSSGVVSVVKVATSSLPSNDAIRCMMDKVKTWKFPKPRGNGNVTIVYPFVFNTI